MHKRSYYIINAITWYRLITAPLLILLALAGHLVLFRWMLGASFFTDAIDGFLSRRYKVTSVFGAKLDSVADDFTIVAALVGMFAFKPTFISQERMFIILLLALFLLQMGLALLRYKKMTSFHTYLAKIAAVMQGLFLLLLFFLPEPPYVMFYAAVITTALDLLEEILLIALLPQWQVNVKGVYWVIKKRKNKLRES